MRLSPVLADLGTYPFVRLEEAKRRLAAEGVSFVDFGIGDPREPVEPFIRQALVDGVEDRMGYPLAQGLPELRGAIAGWCRGRFGVELDPDTEVIPTLGSKEAIFSLAQVALDLAGGKDLVVVTEPGYPVQERGALFAGGRVLKVPLLERNGFLPDLDAIDAETLGAHRRLLGQLPEQPDRRGGAARVLRAPRRARGRARLPARLRRGVHRALLRRAAAVGAPAPVASQRRRLQHAVEALLDDGLPLGLRGRRPRADRGAARVPPHRRHRAAGVRAARRDRRLGRRGARRADARRATRRKREILLEALREKGIRVAGGEATMYLWLEVPGGGSSEAFATALLEHGVVVAPGAFFGPAGEGYVRIALVPTEDECRRAAAILREAL